MGEICKKRRSSRVERRLLRQLQQRIDDFRLRVAEHHDFDLVFRIAQPAHQLLHDARGHRSIVFQEVLEGGVVESERRSIGDRDGRRRSRRAGDEGRFAEQIARAKDHQTALGGAHAFDETHPPFLKQISFAAEISLAIDDLPGSQAFAESLQQPLALSGAEVLHGTFNRTINFRRKAAFTPRSGAFGAR